MSSDDPIERFEREAIQGEADDPLHDLPAEIGSLLPVNGFVRDYLRWAYPMTDAPAEYHLGAAMTALSLATGNRIWIENGPLKLFANVWIVNIGESSYFRKTTAINFAGTVLKAAVSDCLMSEDITPQSLAKKFQDQPNRIILASEFADLLEGMQIEFNRGLKQKFTSLFDVPEEFSKERSSMENSHHAAHPYLVILTATAPEWLKLSEEDLRGGFYARFIFINAKSKRGRFIARQPRPDSHLQLQLVTHLQAIARIGAGVSVDTSQVNDLYENWLVRHVSQCDNFQRPDLLSSFWTRLESYCWKFAILYRLARSARLDAGGLIRIEPDDIGFAIRLTEFHKAQIIDLLSNVFTFNKTGKVQQKLLRMIERKQCGMTLRDIKTWGHFDKRDDVEDELRTLISIGKIRFAEERAANGKPIQKYFPVRSSAAAVQQ